MEVDYDAYAEGEAMLGWLNATALLSAPAPFDGNAADDIVRQLGEAIRSALEAKSVEIAHLKMTLQPDGIGNDLAVANLVRNGSAVELPHALQEPLTSGTLILNLRAEADPNMLREVLRRLLSMPGGLFTIGLKNIEAFRPGRPMPTHRLYGSQASARQTSIVVPYEDGFEITRPDSLLPLRSIRTSFPRRSSRMYLSDWWNPAWHSTLWPTSARYRPPKIHLLGVSPSATGFGSWLVTHGLSRACLWPPVLLCR